MSNKYFKKLFSFDIYHFVKRNFYPGAAFRFNNYPF